MCHIGLLGANKHQGYKYYQYQQIERIHTHIPFLMPEGQPKHQRQWVEGYEIPVPMQSEQVGYKRDIQQQDAYHTLNTE